MNPSTTATIHTPFQQTYFHGTRADLKLGELIEIGYTSNYAERAARYNYLTSTLDPAVWAAELAAGEGRERIYLVEATGPLENDPNVTDKKFPGNPTQSFRSKHPFKVVGEVTIWHSHTAEQLHTMKTNITKAKAQGITAIED